MPLNTINGVVVESLAKTIALGHRTGTHWTHLLSRRAGFSSICKTRCLFGHSQAFHRKHLGVMGCRLYGPFFLAHVKEESSISFGSLWRVHNSRTPPPPAAHQYTSTKIRLLVDIYLMLTQAFKRLVEPPWRSRTYNRPELITNWGRGGGGGGSLVTWVHKGVNNYHHHYSKCRPKQFQHTRTNDVQWTHSKREDIIWSYLVYCYECGLNVVVVSPRGQVNVEH